MFEFLTHKVLAPLTLRLGLAVVFVVHGLLKVNARTDWGTSWDGSGQFPASVQIVVAYGELLGGVALALGFLTRLAALEIAVLVGTSVYHLYAQHGLRLRTGDPATLGYEYNFALLVLCVTLMLTGGGVLALDWLLFAPAVERRTERKPAAPAPGTVVQTRR